MSLNVIFDRHNQGYKRSEDVGMVKVDGTVDGVKSQGRTSENAWCSSRDGCRKAALPQSIHQRIAKVLEIPVENSEDFQILRYEIGQFYVVHQ
jgi:prolyl 4-hydroxylase